MIDDDPLKNLIEPRHIPDFLHVLYRDAHQLGKSCFEGDFAEPPDQVLARSFTRAVFAYIEGGVAVLRAITLHFLHQRLRSSEIAALTENTYDVDERGKIKARKSFKPVERSFLLVCRVLKERLGIESVLAPGDEPWTTLLKAKAVRNRITHPKRPDDLTLTRGETTVIGATLWLFQTAMEQLLGDILARLNEPDPDIEAIAALMNETMEAQAVEDQSSE